MDVTDEMVARAAASMRTDFALDTEDAARAALEAALADVPEPDELETFHEERHALLGQDYERAVRDSRRHYERAETAEARIAELEAQLKGEYVRGRAEALRELQRACVAHGGVYDAETNVVIDADELERRIAILKGGA